LNSPWTATKTKLAGELSNEEARIVDMLIASKTMVDIGRELGQHRSMVWRKIQRIKKRAAI
jgi:hypothetical protein